MSEPVARRARTPMGLPYIVRSAGYGLASVVVMLGIERLIHEVMQRTGELGPGLPWRPDLQFHLLVFAGAAAGAMLAMHVAGQLPLKWWLVVAAAVVYGIATQLGARLAFLFFGESLGTVAWFVGGATLVAFLAHIWNERG